MGDLNVEQGEAEAIKGVDRQVLGRLVDRCLELEQATPLRDLRLEDCGL